MDFVQIRKISLEKFECWFLDVKILINKRPKQLQGQFQAKNL